MLNFNVSCVVFFYGFSSTTFYQNNITVAYEGMIEEKQEESKKNTSGFRECFFLIYKMEVDSLSREALGSKREKQTHWKFSCSCKGFCYALKCSLLRAEKEIEYANG